MIEIKEKRVIIEDDQIGVVKSVDSRKLKERNAKKFKFEWSDEDDTTNGHDPFSHSNNSTGFVPKAEFYNSKHWSEKSYQEMTSRDWKIFREDNDILLRSPKDVSPLRTWSEMKLEESLIIQLCSLGLVAPTPVQMQCVPIIDSGHDLVALSRTGSGKTLAYILPIVRKIYRLKHSIHEVSNFCLIIVPTRELAIQVSDVISSLNTKLKPVTLIGGHSIQDQVLELHRGFDFIIGTPGRLLDCHEQRLIDFSFCNTLVVDEFDRLMEMNFQDDIVAILKLLSDSRQTLMFSATLNKEQESLAFSMTKEKILVKVGQGSVIPSTISQELLMVNEDQKMHRFITILEENIDKTILVFVNQKESAEQLSRFLRSREFFDFFVLHSDKNQKQRDYIMKAFKEGLKSILITTDLAGRGIDVRNISLVVNFDAPQTFDKYVHRIGRTGRAGSKGHAITFLTEGDNELASKVSLLQQNKMCFL